MSLLTSEIYPVLGPAVSADDVVTATLTRTGRGWTLTTRRGEGPRSGWATPLAAHGAGADAPSRVAQAVAVRVLHELGVEVGGWGPAPAGPDRSDDDAVELVAVTADRVPPPRRPRGVRGH